MVPIGEHAVMTAGTTNNFGNKNSCAWHFVSASPYFGIKKI